MSWLKMGIGGLFGRNRECNEVRRRASDYLDSDISEEDRQRILKHLEECENCPTFIESLRATISSLGSLPARAIPQRLKQKLLEIPEEESRSPH